MTRPRQCQQTRQPPGRLQSPCPANPNSRRLSPRHPRDGLRTTAAAVETSCPAAAAKSQQRTQIPAGPSRDCRPLSATFHQFTASTLNGHDRVADEDEDNCQSEVIPSDNQQAFIKQRRTVTALPTWLLLGPGLRTDYARCSIGTYSRSISPVYSSNGLMRMLSLYCSMHWRVHPGMRPRAKMEMNRSSGMSSR